MTNRLSRVKQDKMFQAVLMCLISFVLAFSGSLAVAAPHSGHDSGVGAERPAWLNKLEEQVRYEEMMGGMEGRQEKLDKTYLQMMDRLKGKLMEHTKPASSGGMFHGSWAAHQLGMGYLLGPAEQVTGKINAGGHCPSGIPVKSYHVMAINVEITLNQWGDYFPGYMYVLEEEVARVREEEVANAKARSDDLDPGMVSTGLQGDAIQPLVLRANQGD